MLMFLGWWFFGWFLTMWLTHKLDGASSRKDFLWLLWSPIIWPLFLLAMPIVIYMNHVDNLYFKYKKFCEWCGFDTQE